MWQGLAGAFPCCGPYLGDVPLLQGGSHVREGAHISIINRLWRLYRHASVCQIPQDHPSLRGMLPYGAQISSPRNTHPGKQRSMISQPRDLLAWEEVATANSTTAPTVNMIYAINKSNTILQTANGCHRYYEKLSAHLHLLYAVY